MSEEFKEWRGSCLKERKCEEARGEKKTHVPPSSFKVVRDTALLGYVKNRVIVIIQI